MTPLFTKNPALLVDNLFLATNECHMITLEFRQPLSVHIKYDKPRITLVRYTQSLYSERIRIMLHSSW